ncbi:SPP1 Gp6-like portal protein [Microbacterium sp. AG1240]|uniref:phage portal protein n=1 Tax=Microbacterium sp. AG1240 TaxID=2183992 RepID=UPI000EACF3B0|nr:phage portal protein [Microbacterium sp. AG1240]RKT33668.1 SPP1 Gp6-like portal protein [Microbacterium sp. AG1240]
MSLETFRVPGLTDAETIDLNVNLAQLKDRQRGNLLRSSLYDGKRAVKQIGSVIPPQYTKIGLALGWTAKGVDGLGRRCVLEKMVWPEGDIGSLGINELTDSNFLMAEIAQGRTDSLIHGVSYLITTRGEGDEPRALVHTKDALNATGQWNTRKRRLDNLLSITSWEGDDPSGFVLYLDGVTVNASRAQNGQWDITRSVHPWHVPADPLVYRPRTSKRMGRSRITRAAISTQDAALRALVRLEAHMDIYAIPKLILLGADESIFKNADGSLKASWQIALGRAFGIPDNEDAAAGQPARADVKQFDASSPEPHLAHLNALAKLMAREMDLSDSDFALTDLANPTSADSYSEARESLIAEAEDATDGWSTPIRRSVTRALAIQNDLDEIPAAWAGIDTKWRNPVHLSRAAAADAGAKQLGAVPWLAETEVGLELIGLDEQQIKRALAEKQRAAGRAVIAALAPRANADAAAV